MGVLRGLAERIGRVDASIFRRPIAFLIASIFAILVVGDIAYQLRQAEVTVVLSLLTLYAALRFSSRWVYLITLGAHVTVTYLAMVAVNENRFLALYCATAAILIYAELSFRGARSRERIDKERQRHLDNLALLEHIRTAIARELNFSAIAALAVDAIARATNYPRTAIYTVAVGGTTLLSEVGWPDAPRLIPSEAGVIGRAITTGMAQWESASDRAPARADLKRGRSAVAAPIFDGDAVIAAITVETKSEDVRPVLNEYDVTLVQSVAQEIGIAMSRARLHESAQRERDEYEQVTRALGQALCLYDREGPRSLSMPLLNDCWVGHWPNFSRSPCSDS